MAPETPGLHIGLIISDDDRLLLVRRGHGPSGGFWDLPTAAVERGQTIAETGVHAASAESGVEAILGEFVDFQELLDGDEHVVRLVFEGLLPGDVEPIAGEGVAQARWWAISDLAALDFSNGLADVLHDHGVPVIVH